MRSLVRVCLLGGMMAWLQLSITLAAQLAPNSPALKVRAWESDAFFRAVQAGDVTRVRALLKKDKRLLGLDGLFLHSPLICAIQRHRPQVVKLLLTQGADIYHTDEVGRTPFHYAIVCHEPKIVLWLLQLGFPVNRRNKFGDSALSDAVCCNRPDVVALLLRHHADPNIQGEDGMTPLMTTAWRGYAEEMKLLLAYHADVNLKDKDGDTALMLAQKYHQPKVEQLLRKAGATQ